MKLQKFILYFFLLIGIFSTSQAQIADSGAADWKDEYICSNIDHLKVPDQIFIDEARKRTLKCENYDFSIPENAHIDQDQNSWTCDIDYYKVGSECEIVPANSYSGFDSNYWFCNNSYYKDSRKSCRLVPSNSTIWKNGLGFNCNFDYKKSSSGNSCIKNQIKSNPINSHTVENGWICDTNYYKNTDTTCLKVPLHATSSYNSNDFICNTGYELNAARNACVLIIPENAHPTSNGWSCNSGYIKNAIGNGCVTKPTTPKNNNDLKSVIILIVIVVVLWFIFKPSSSKPTPRTQPRSTTRTQPKSKPTPIPKPQPTHPSKYKPPLKPRPKVVQRSQPKPAPKTQPKQAPKTQPKHVNRIKDLPALLNKIGNHNCRELTNEFREWNGKILLAKTTEESKDIQKILDFIAKRREDNNC